MPERLSSRASLLSERCSRLHPERDVADREAKLFVLAHFSEKCQEFEIETPISVIGDDDITDTESTCPYFRTRKAVAHGVRITNSVQRVFECMDNRFVWQDVHYWNFFDLAISGNEGKHRLLDLAVVARLVAVMSQGSDNLALGLGAAAWLLLQVLFGEEREFAHLTEAGPAEELGDSS